MIFAMRSKDLKKCAKKSSYIFFKTKIVFVKIISSDAFISTASFKILTRSLIHIR